MRKLIMLAGLVIGLSVLGAGTATAATFLSEDRSYVGPDQVVDGTLYAAGSTVTIAGTVKGDVMCAGQNIEITGTVEGDVLCAGQQVRISGPVGGDVRVAGQLVTLSGKVAGSATMFGQSVTVDSAASVGKDLTLGAQTVNLMGDIGRDVSGAGEAVTLSGPVGRSVALEVGQLALTSTARVEGSLTYGSAKEAQVAQGATVVGATVRNEPTAQYKQDNQETFASRVSGAAFWFVCLVVMGAAILLVKPQVLPATAQSVRQQPWGVLGWGLVGLLGAPLLAFLLMITIVGIPLGVLVLLVWGIALIVSLPLAGHAVGRIILTQTGAKMGERWLPFASLALGLLLILLLSLLPLIGGAIHFVAIVLGVGALLELIRHRSTVAKTPKVKGKLV